MKYLLDTDTCVFWLRGHDPLRDRVASVAGEDSAETLAISVVTLAELRYGAEYSDRPAENHEAIGGFLQGLTIVTVSPAVANLFGEIKAHLRGKGSLIEDLDILIAATARAHDLTLVTNNEGHFARVVDLSFENWLRT